MTDTPEHPKPSLYTQLLAELGFLASAAILIVTLSTLLLVMLDPSGSTWAFLALWAGSSLVFLAFLAVRLRRLVVRPLDLLGEHTERLAAGDETPVPPFETIELEELRDRFTNMTAELLDARDQVIRSEKLAAIGELAAGVAHEIRNPLGAVSNYVAVLERRAEGPPLQRPATPSDTELYTAMRLEIERIDRTIQGLLDFARPKTGREGSADLNAVVQRTIEFLHAQGALRDVTVVTDLEATLPEIATVPHAIEQVLVNLVLNARDAAPEGRILIGTRALRWVARDEGRARAGEGGRHTPSRSAITRPRRLEIPEGTPGALLYVADSGPGVPDDVRERVFEPFVTTKPAGKGSGLGLAIVARTVHESGGMVWVDRARQGGAVFKVFLPFDRAA